MAKTNVPQPIVEKLKLASTRTNMHADVTTACAIYWFAFHDNLAYMTALAKLKTSPYAGKSGINNSMVPNFLFGPHIDYLTDGAYTTKIHYALEEEQPKVLNKAILKSDFEQAKHDFFPKEKWHMLDETIDSEYERGWVVNDHNILEYIVNPPTKGTIICVTNPTTKKLASMLPKALNIAHVTGNSNAVYLNPKMYTPGAYVNTHGQIKVEGKDSSELMTWGYIEMIKK